MTNVSRISVDSGRMKNGHPNAIRVEHNSRLAYATEVHVGAGRFITSPIARPYGATIWFETTEPVILCAAEHEELEMEAAA